MITDMSIGKPPKVIVNFSIPIVISGVFQQLYNIMDSLIAGKFAGVGALAAVGASYPIVMLFIAIAIGGSMGATIVIAQLFGSKKYEELKGTATTALFFMFLLSIAVTVFGVFYSKILLEIVNTPSDLMSDSLAYLKIYFLGMMFMFMYNTATAIFNGLGDSKTPLYLLLFSSLFNIFLDYIFVAVFKWGVLGVAWGTFIAQGIASVFAMIIVLKRLIQIKTKKRIMERFFQIRLLNKMAVIAVPSIFQQSVVAIGQLLVQALVNRYGGCVVAGYSAAIKLDSFFKIVLLSLSNGLSSYTAQNYGADKKERLTEGVKFTALMGVGYAIIITAIVNIYGKTFIKWFISDNTSEIFTQTVINVGNTYMIIVSMFYICFALLMTLCGFMRGLGYMRGFTCITMLDLSIRVIGAYVLALFIGYNAIWWSISLGWTVALFVGSIVFLKFAAPKYLSDDSTHSLSCLKTR